MDGRAGQRETVWTGRKGNDKSEGPLVRWLAQNQRGSRKRKKKLERAFTVRVFYCILFTRHDTTRQEKKRQDKREEGWKEGKKEGRKSRIGMYIANGATRPSQEDGWSPSQGHSRTSQAHSGSAPE